MADPTYYPVKDELLPVMSWLERLTEALLEINKKMDRIEQLIKEECDGRSS